MMSITAEEVAAGQAIYTKRILRAYDRFVLGFSNRFLWKCPTPRLLSLQAPGLHRLAWPGVALAPD